MQEDGMERDAGSAHCRERADPQPETLPGRCSRYRIASDIGGTFTDFAVIDDSTQELRLGKVLTTPQDAEQGIFDGIAQLQGESPELVTAASDIVHGTTLVINALIERKGSRTALLCTEGFRDILEMRDGLRYDVYDLQIEYPPPLVPRSLRMEVAERMSSSGDVLVPLTDAEIGRIARRVRDEEIESVAICFLHSYANDLHEKAMAEGIRRVAPDVSVSLSSAVLPRINEYHRTSTVVANAFVKPQVQAYLGKLARGLEQRGFGGQLYVMQSTTGVMERKTAQELPVNILESGPAGGVAAAIWWANHYGAKDALCFDMGGTTAKLCPVIDGRAFVTDNYEAGRAYRFKRGSGYSINVPVVDLLEIGTGGGSIAEVDRLGLLRVGPKSAGAVPGPACYARGGKRPTVTDADLVLGYLDERHFLGGSMPLQRSEAVGALDAHVGSLLDLSSIEAAQGIHHLANEDMAAAARLHLAERGESAEHMALIAYGGAGPVHACGLAERLGCKTVLIPPAAGVMSALGMLVADIAMERIRTFRAALADVEAASIFAAIGDLQREICAGLGESTAGRLPRFESSLELRYAGQGYTITVALPDEPRTGRMTIAAIERAFRDAYMRLYGRLDEDAPVELISIRVQGRVVRPRSFEPRRLAAASDPVESALRGYRDIFFGTSSAAAACPIYERSRLRPGHVVIGPAVVEERETTTVVTPGARLEVDPFGLLIIDLEPA